MNHFWLGVGATIFTLGVWLFGFWCGYSMMADNYGWDDEEAA